jgi:hypothetical protein
MITKKQNQMPAATERCAPSTGYALERVAKLWRERTVPPRPISMAMVIHADTPDDAIAELEDMINRLRTGEYTEGRGVGRHVTFAWHAHTTQLADA